MSARTLLRRRNDLGEVAHLVAHSESHVFDLRSGSLSSFRVAAPHAGQLYVFASYAGLDRHCVFRHVYKEGLEE